MVLRVHAARADRINLTGAETSFNIAEITVMNDHVRVVLEAYVGDLEAFEDLVPDDGVSELGVERPDISSRMKHFSAQVLQIITADGETLQAELVRVEPRQRIDRKSPFAGMINPYSRQRVAEAPADKRVLKSSIRLPASPLDFYPAAG